MQEGWSTATKIFIRLLTHESFEQLCLVFDEYRLISGISMQEAIKSTFSGDMCCAALAIGERFYYSVSFMHYPDSADSIYCIVLSRIRNERWRNEIRKKQKVF